MRQTVANSRLGHLILYAKTAQTRKKGKHCWYRARSSNERLQPQTAHNLSLVIRPLTCRAAQIFCANSDVRFTRKTVNLIRFQKIGGCNWAAYRRWLSGSPQE